MIARYPTQYELRKQEREMLREIHNSRFDSGKERHHKHTTLMTFADFEE